MVVVLCLRLPLLLGFCCRGGTSEIKAAKCGLERSHWRRAMRSTCETERGRVGVLM